MRISRWLRLAIAVSPLLAGAACTRQAADDVKRDTDAALEATEEGIDTAVDATREAGQQAADATRNIAQKTADKTTEIAETVRKKTTGIVSATGEAITDGWITTAVRTAFVGEDLLKGSDIDVDTTDHVVTLKGVVGSRAAKTRAVTLARDTTGVTGVIDQLVVR